MSVICIPCSAQCFIRSYVCTWGIMRMLPTRNNMNEQVWVRCQYHENEWTLCFHLLTPHGEVRTSILQRHMRFILSFSLKYSARITISFHDNNVDIHLSIIEQSNRGSRIPPSLPSSMFLSTFYEISSLVLWTLVVYVWTHNPQLTTQSKYIGTDGFKTLPFGISTNTHAYIYV